MRSTTLYVSKRGITEVAEFIGDHKIDNAIQGLTEDGEIMIGIKFERDESETIKTLEAMVDDYIEPEEEEEEDN